MSEFKIGESVRAYEGSVLYRGKVIDPPQCMFPGAVHVLCEIDPQHHQRRLFHWKQLRRLKKKRKPIVVTLKKLIERNPYEQSGPILSFKCDELLPLIGKRVSVTVKEIV